MANTKTKGEDILNGSVKPIDLDLSGAADIGSHTTTDIFYVATAAAPTVLKKTTLSAIQSAAWAAQNANKVWAGPGSGGDAAPAFRVLVEADMPGKVVLNDGASSKVATIVVCSQTTYNGLSKVATTLYVITS